MTKADAVFVQRLGDDDVLHAVGVEIALFGQIGDAAIAPDSSSAVPDISWRRNSRGGFL